MVVDIRPDIFFVGYDVACLKLELYLSHQRGISKSASYIGFRSTSDENLHIFELICCMYKIFDQVAAEFDIALVNSIDDEKNLAGELAKRLNKELGKLDRKRLLIECCICIKSFGDECS